MLKGKVWTDMGWLNHKFGANFTTKVTKGTPTKITNSVVHAAYGVVGSGGVGLVYSKTLSTSCNKVKSCTIDESEPYSGVVAYWSTNAKATLYYSGGSLSIYSP